MKISAVSQHKCDLGEGPLWDPVALALYWVDSLAPALYRLDYRSQVTQVWHLSGKSVGSLAIREQGGLILAMDHGFYFFSPQSGELQLIGEPLEGRYGVRFNDGKVDPFGSFIAGAMNIDHSDIEDCPVYRLTKDLQVEEILSGFSTFNGPCFNKTGTRLYLTGRPGAGIEMLPYFADQQPGPARTIFESVNCDGATVDNQGYLWTAQWSDQCIVRLTPSGEIDAKIIFPEQIVSSVMFGGPDLDLIYVTTVGAKVSGAKSCSPLAGQTLVVEGAGYVGRPEPMFKG